MKLTDSITLSREIYPNDLHVSHKSSYIQVKIRKVEEKKTYKTVELFNTGLR